MLRRRRRDPEAASEPDERELEIIEATRALRDTSVREVMTPRVDVVALEAPVTTDAVRRAVRESGHSRFPVYQGDLDHLVGVLFVKDLLRSDGTEVTPLRQPFLVPESTRVLDALGEMRRRRNAFAVVVDEHGGIEGVVTVKDLVSELVGELPDEFDRPMEADITPIDRERWLVDGACPVDRVCEEIGVALPEGEYVTLGGFLFDRFGRIPTEGEAVVHQGWELRVAVMDNRRIAKVVVRAPGAEAPPTPEEGPGPSATISGPHGK
jgi:CBS domain containing-hemolysin-like protein